MTCDLRPSLLSQLLAERHRIPESTIVDCLALAQLVDRRPRQRLHRAMLMRQLGCLEKKTLDRKLRRLRLCDLIEYEAGCRDDPGYWFLRIGPPAKLRPEAPPDLRRFPSSGPAA